MCRRVFGDVESRQATPVLREMRVWREKFVLLLYPHDCAYEEDGKTAFIAVCRTMQHPDAEATLRAMNAFRIAGVMAQIHNEQCLRVPITPPAPASTILDPQPPGILARIVGTVRKLFGALL